MRLGALLPHMHLDAANAAIDISGLCYDSRRAKPGCLFAAWRGTQLDGHAYVADVIARGAHAILCERAPDVVPDGVAVIVAADVRRTLAQMARIYYGDPSAALCMVGVTGTNGKTSCVHLIEGMLAHAGKKPGMIGTLGAKFAHAIAPTQALEAALMSASGLTTPESVDLVAVLDAMRRAGAEAVAMEASSQALHQERLAGVAFDVGVFTNLTHDHLDYHGDLETYFAAKAQLLRTHMKPSGTAVLNDDDARVRSLSTPTSLRFSATYPKGRAAGGAAPDVFVKHAALGPLGTRLKVQTPRGLLQIDSPLLGAFNTANLLAAVGVGEALGLSHAVMAEGLGQVPCVPGRLQAVSREGEPLVVVDYAHTPDALRQALSAMRALTQGRLVCVFGCGGDRDPHKRAPMGQAAYHGADWSVITNDNPRRESPAAIADAIAGGMQSAGAHMSETLEKGGYCVALDRGAAIARALGAARSTDTVLIAGKGHEDYQITGTTKRDFDDRIYARRALDERAKRLSSKEAFT